MRENKYDTVTKHAIETLELEAVFGLIASNCVNEGSRRSLQTIRMFTNPQEIKVALGEIEEMRQYRALQGDIPIADTSCRHSIDRARERGESLDEKELLAIAGAEKECLALLSKFKKHFESYPLLDRIISRLTPQKELVMRIEKAIDREGLVRDSASEKLREIRKNIRKTKVGVRTEAERLSKRFGKNAYATLLGARHVLLLPREAIRKRDGIVHSASQSGGSLYFEPFTLVELNNMQEALVNDESAEVLRILAELAEAVVQSSEALIGNLDAMECMDVLKAKAIFSDAFGCITPGFSGNGGLRLNAAKHPLLLVSLKGAGRESELVPLEFELPERKRVMVITGPNAGGKTVTLKTVGLLVLMFQCGLQVPCAQGSEFPVFERVFADIEDEQSIESSLSTFTSHLRHLDAMCRYAGKETLCLIDEIGDGTDPDEGASLANASLEKLLSKGAAVVATTHYGKVKMFALQKPGIENASMAFSDDQNRPMFRLLHGFAGRSRGIETARRCGFDADVVKRAESFLGEEAFRLERLLSELESNHFSLERERAALAKQSEALRLVIERYAEKEKALDSSRASHSEKVRSETKEMLLNARREIEQIVKNIRESGARKDLIRDGHERIRSMLKKVGGEKPAKKVLTVTIGDRVSLNPTGKPEGVVLDVQDNLATIEISGKRIKIKKENLYKLERSDASPATGVSWDVDVEPLGLSMLDVRGMEREEALDAVDRFIDRAVLSGAHEVTIVHGVGEGILLKAIRAHLSQDKRVKSFRSGVGAEGGAGVSIVQLG